MRVESASGRLEISRTAFGAASWSRLDAGETVGAGSWVRTDSASRAELRFGEARLAMEASTLLRFDGSRFAFTHLVMPSGRLHLSAEGLRHRSYFSVSAPIVSIGVRGTEYELTVFEIGASLVRMIKGLAEARTGETAIPLPAGAALAADPFEGIRPLTPEAAADIDAWRRVFSVAQTSPDSVTNAYRPITMRQVAIIRATFDRLMDLYKRRAEVDAIGDPEEQRVAHERLLADARELYREIVEGRGRLDAIAVVVERMRTVYGAPAPWVDQAITGYRGIWDGWLEMITAFIEQG